MHLLFCLKHLYNNIFEEWEFCVGGKLLIYKLRELRGIPQVYSSLQIAVDGSREAKLSVRQLLHNTQLLQDVPEFLLI